MDNDLVDVNEIKYIGSKITKKVVLLTTLS